MSGISGLVHLKHFLKLPAQELLVQQASALAFAPHPHRRRHYGPLEEMPFLAWCGAAAALSATQQAVAYTHYIALHYAESTESPRIPWHQDNGENDGEDDAPIVSLSVGDSCCFQVSQNKPKIGEAATELLLESGDALIWHASARGLWHSVSTVHSGSSPLASLVGRYNFTLRYTPHLFGREREFLKISDGLPKENKFYKL